MRIERSVALSSGGCGANVSCGARFVDRTFEWMRVGQRALERHHEPVRLIDGVDPLARLSTSASPLALVMSWRCVASAKDRP